jgi:crossover junction endodeoxyribonuclease RuvC
MLVIGIDPGTATTGYGLVRENPDGSIAAVDYGVLTTPARMPMQQRLLDLHQQLRNTISLHHPQSGAVEKLFFQRNVTTAISVGQARGIVLLALAEAAVEVAEYSPLEVKKAIVGYGGAEKKQMQMMVKAILDLDEVPSPDDAADALAIAICHLHSLRIRTLGQGSE